MINQGRNLDCAEEGEVCAGRSEEGIRRVRKDLSWGEWGDGEVDVDVNGGEGRRKGLKWERVRKVEW